MVTVNFKNLTLLNIKIYTWWRTYTRENERKRHKFRYNALKAVLYGVQQIVADERTLRTRFLRCGRKKSITLRTTCRARIRNCVLSVISKNFLQPQQNQFNWRVVWKLTLIETKHLKFQCYAELRLYMFYWCNLLQVVWNLILAFTHSPHCLLYTSRCV